MNSYTKHRYGYTGAAYYTWFKVYGQTGFSKMTSELSNDKLIN